jgi:hypothetical protein
VENGLSEDKIEDRVIDWKAAQKFLAVDLSLDLCSVNRGFKNRLD